MMRTGDTALLVIDMQQRLLPALPAARHIAWNCRRLIDGAVALEVATAITEQNPGKLGTTLPELASRLPPAHPKMSFSCGDCGPLFAAWQAARIERALLCGIETHVCVQQTALDLLAAGYRVYIAADAVGARGAIDHEVALRRLESCGATITTTEAALFELCERAGSDPFRTISGLAKESPPAG